MNRRYEARFLSRVSIVALLILICSCSAERPGDNPAHAKGEEARTRSTQGSTPDREFKTLAEELALVYESEPMIAFYEKVERAEEELNQELEKTGKITLFSHRPQTERIDLLLRLMVFRRFGSSTIDALQPGDREFLRERLPTGIRWFDHVHAQPLAKGLWIFPLVRLYAEERKLAFYATEIRVWEEALPEHVATLQEFMDLTYQAEFLADRIRRMSEPSERDAKKKELRRMIGTCLNKLISLREIAHQRSQQDIDQARELLRQVKSGSGPEDVALAEEALIHDMENNLVLERSYLQTFKEDYETVVDHSLTQLIYHEQVLHPLAW
jgi:hypothetical protein